MRIVAEFLNKQSDNLSKAYQQGYSSLKEFSIKSDKRLEEVQKRDDFSMKELKQENKKHLTDIDKLKKNLFDEKLINKENKFNYETCRKDLTTSTQQKNNLYDAIYEVVQNEQINSQPVKNLPNILQIKPVNTDPKNLLMPPYIDAKKKILFSVVKLFVMNQIHIH